VPCNDYEADHELLKILGLKPRAPFKDRESKVQPEASLTS